MRRLTISWQGQTGAGPGIAGTTIFAGLQTAGGVANVTYSSNGTAITGADKIVCVVGESPYAEGSGDAHGLNFSVVLNYSLIQTCVSSGKPVILVMLTGRPMLLTSPATSCQAIWPWLPAGKARHCRCVIWRQLQFYRNAYPYLACYRGADSHQCGASILPMNRMRSGER